MMNKSKVFIMIAAILVLLIFASFFLMKKPEVAMVEPVQSIAPVEPEKQQATPIVRHHLPETPPIEQSPNAETLNVTPPPPPKPLPLLEDSDQDFLSELAQIADQDTLQQLLVDKSVISRAVVTIDNLTTRSLPNKHLVTRAVKGSFKAREVQPGIFEIEEKNYQRYEPYIDLFEKVDIKKLVTLYVRYYPLLQQSFEQLGYGNLYFNDRLVVLIDHLLETPEVLRPKLVLPSVMYRFADPELENLSAGQKILIRMGPDNARRVKQRLEQIREAVTGFSKAQN